jgi:hypothetical protein
VVHDEIREQFVQISVQHDVSRAVFFVGHGVSSHLGSEAQYSGDFGMSITAHSWPQSSQWAAQIIP